jgi:hypothetical protein
LALLKGPAFNGMMALRLVAVSTGGLSTAWRSRANRRIRPSRARGRPHVRAGVARKHGENELLFRLGSAYKLERGRISFGPQYALDFVGDERSHVFGVSLGVLF